jgi:hypothetical protein
MKHRIGRVRRAWLSLIDSRNASAAGEIMVRAKSNGGQHQMKLAPLKSGARVTNGW